MIVSRALRPSGAAGIASATAMRLHAAPLAAAASWRALAPARGARRAASTAASKAHTFELELPRWGKVTGDLFHGGGGPAPDVVLHLPALSTVSTRKEGHAMLERISEHSTRMAFDWPGWGDLRPTNVTHRGHAMMEYLRSLINAIGKELPDSRIHLVMAGHGCSYALGVLSTSAQPIPGLMSLTLVSPTFRGPLPTLLSRKINLPTLERVALTALRNIERQLKAHVYGDPSFATPELIAAKAQETRHPGAFNASLSFVTGGLDLYRSKPIYLCLSQGVMVGFSRIPGCSVNVLVGRAAPPSSKADMEDLAGTPGATRREVPGALLPHEEHPEAVAAVVDEAIRVAARECEPLYDGPDMLAPPAPAQ
eukprot:tig00020553_g10685.t1